MGSLDAFQHTLVRKFWQNQWSPWNPQGKKMYDRRFLLRLRFHPLSLEKPDNLLGRDDLKEIVLEDPLYEQKCNLCTGSLPKSDMTQLSDSSDPETKTEKLYAEIVLEMVPNDDLSKAAETVLNDVNKFNVIPVFSVLHMMRNIGPMESKENIEVQNSTCVSKSDHWTPQNPSGKKKYGRDFLLKLHSQPMCLKIPKDFYNFDSRLKESIILFKNSFKHDKCHACEMECHPNLIFGAITQTVNKERMFSFHVKL